MQFGERLKELRSAKGMTQKDLAEKINISPQAVSRWENNEVPGNPAPTGGNF